MSRSDTKDQSKKHSIKTTFTGHFKHPWKVARTECRAITKLQEKKLVPESVSML